MPNPILTCYRLALAGALCVGAAMSGPAAETFRVVTFNVANYLDTPVGTRPVKSQAAKGKVRESILAMKPDVLNLVEIGSLTALMELQASLKKEGLDLPHWEHVEGYDTNIHVAVLSRFPFAARHSHTNESYLLFGRRFFMSRGIAELDIQVNPRYQFTMFGVHLKSKRPVPEAEEADMREQEAQILREKIDARLNRDPNVNLLIAGDLNDTKDSRAVQAIIGRANTRHGLVDTRPAERNGDQTPPANPRWDPPNITWTHFYGKEDTYSRIDYLMVSKSMAKEWVTNATYVLALPNWGLASDHRPIVATFVAEEK